MGLEAYRAKRNFRDTPEPPPERIRGHQKPIFVVEEHHASRLHYDFRLEADGVLKSWAVPKQPSLDPSQKRLAVHLEDHPLSYAKLAGTIPEGHYGAGTVAIWDHGTYENLLTNKLVPQSVTEGVDAGRLEFQLHGERLRGRFALIRMKGRGKENWLLIKMKDEFARPDATAGNGKVPRHRGSHSRVAQTAVRTARVPASRVGEVEVSHPETVMFPGAGITKGDVFDFYRRVAPRLLPFLRDRPATLERLPEGMGDGKPHFWQKNTPDYYPAWIPRAELPSGSGKAVQYVLVNDLPTLLYLVNQGTLTFHVWFSRVDDVDRPDFVLFDLDPGQAEFTDVVEVAKTLHGILDSAGREAFVKTSGKTGLHVLVAWDEAGGYDEARAWALEVAKRVVEAMPEQATTEIRKVQRHGRVYVDTMQNAKGHHAVPPYVLRPVPGAPVSTPLDWRELKATLDPLKFTLKSFFTRLGQKKREPLAGLLRDIKK